MTNDNDATRSLRGMLRLMRPAQWTKNGFVLAGFIFARQWFDTALLADALLTFAAFCAAASATYALNDWLDIESDRAHPGKRHRPLASGQVSLSAALGLSAVLLVIALVTAAAAGMGSLTAVVGYLALNVVYSIWLKHVVIADVFAVAAGFMIRLLAGTTGIGIPPSDWLVLTGLFLTLFLGFAKRRAEWIDASNADERSRRRRVMHDYTTELLDTFLAVTATAAILSYGLYTVSPETQRLHGTTALVYTVPFVTFGIFRYLFLVHIRGRGEDPSSDIFSDPQVLACAALWLATTAWLLRI